METNAENVSSVWVDGMLNGLRDSHRFYERKQGDMEDAAGRTLGLKKVGLVSSCF